MTANQNHTWRKQALKFALLLLVGVSLHVHAGLFGIGGDSWKEEVLLHDGQKIIVERSQTYGGRSEPGQSGPIAEHSIRFTVPGASRFITWTSEYSEDIGRTNFNLLAVHVKEGSPYLVVEPNLCLSYNKWGRPNPPYVFFKFEGDAWQRIPLEQFPVEFETINVALSIRGGELKNMLRMNLVPSDTIKQMNAHREQPEYKTILREAVNGGWRSCPAMVSYGKTGGWIGLDWFTDQPSLDACLKFCNHKNVSAETCPCDSIFKGKK